jgi:hypothetical protein
VRHAQTHDLAVDPAARRGPRCATRGEHVAADHFVWLPLGIIRFPAVGGRGGLKGGFTFRFDPEGTAEAEGAAEAVVGGAASATGTGAVSGGGAMRFPDVGGGSRGGGVPASGSAVGAGRLPLVGGDGVHAAAR